MRVLVVFNHPYEGSFCNALLQSTLSGLHAAGHETDLIPLDNDGFDPVMRAKDLKAFVTAQSNRTGATELLDPQLRDYMARIEQADHILFIFPIWWELMPALMKGFIDKLIFPGFVYDYTPSNKGMTLRMERLKGVTMITTMNTPGLIYRLLFGNAIKKALLLGTFWKIGIKKRRWISFNSVKFVKPEQREEWLAQVETEMHQLA
ncbi:NAD(P)H-dependent oxidoreductase [Shimia sediminis]|uniref:NAD(P)H-dependent oxidoreductase n=1 Tax=Shimia sediminis TaxID=2497945 RepID=UPI000F8D87BF|nr:NAD(P)H-dependent oxidoreductase [Shimia sediminis]